MTDKITSSGGNMRQESSFAMYGLTGGGAHGRLIREL
jgi:hypothetical protein